MAHARPRPSSAPEGELRAETGRSRIIQTNSTPNVASVADSITLSSQQAVNLILVVLVCFLLFTLVVVTHLRFLLARREQLVRLDVDDALLLGAALRNSSASAGIPPRAEQEKPRQTAVADLSHDSEMLNGIHTTMADDWEAREEQAQRHEAKMVQAVVEQNIAISGQLAAVAQ